MRWITWLGMAWLCLWGCTPEAPPGRPPVPAEDYDRVIEENAELRERNAELEARGAAPPAVPECPQPRDVVSLQEQVRALSSDLGTARAAAALYEGRAGEYEEGLERCVEALNTVQGSRRIVIGEGQQVERPPTWSGSATRVPGPLSPSRPAPERPLRPVRTLSAPDVDVAGESIVVSARLWNPEPVERRVTVEIAVVVDGVARDTKTQSLIIPASGDHAVAETFHLRSYRGAIAGRVRVLED